MKSGKSKSFSFTNLLNLYVTEKEDVGNMVKLSYISSLRSRNGINLNFSPEEILIKDVE